jgi:hypothetical protein
MALDVLISVVSRHRGVSSETTGPTQSWITKITEGHDLLQLRVARADPQAPHPGVTSPGHAPPGSSGQRNC